VEAAVCHDGTWEPDEFCGRDALLVTGEAEMNHDCRFDMLDVKLFENDFALVAPNLSGDYDGDWDVDISDWFVGVVPSAGNPVPGCVPCGLPDLCQGTIALSFDSDPNTIVSTRSQAPGTGVVFLVVSGWADAQVLEYGLEASPNIQFVFHFDPPHPFWPLGSALAPCDPDPQHGWRSWIGLGLTPVDWPTGPVVWTTIEYLLLDSDPAWIKLVPTIPPCTLANGNPSTDMVNRIRWAKETADRSYDFATVLHVGINGPAPPSEDNCQAPASLTRVVRDSIGCDASGANCTSAATDLQQTQSNEGTLILAYDPGLALCRSFQLEELRAVAAERNGGPIDVPNTSFDLLGWSSLAAALSSPSSGDVFNLTGLVPTNVVDPFGTANPPGGSADSVLLEFEGLDALTGDTGERLELFGPDARFGLQVTSPLGQEIEIVETANLDHLDVQLPSGNPVPDMGVTVVPEPRRGVMFLFGVGALGWLVRCRGRESMGVLGKSASRDKSKSR
jgi:hypothetical protein